MLNTKHLPNFNIVVFIVNCIPDELSLVRYLSKTFNPFSKLVASLFVQIQKLSPIFMTFPFTVFRAQKGHFLVSFLGSRVVNSEFKSYKRIPMYFAFLPFVLREAGTK